MNYFKLHTEILYRFLPTEILHTEILHTEILHTEILHTEILHTEIKIGLMITPLSKI